MIDLLAVAIRQRNLAGGALPSARATLLTGLLLLGGRGADCQLPQSDRGLVRRFHGIHRIIAVVSFIAPVRNAARPLQPGGVICHWQSCQHVQFNAAFRRGGAMSA